MRTFTFVFLACLLSTPGARADEKSHRQAVLELFEDIEMGAAFTTMFEQMIQKSLREDPRVAQYESVMREFFAKHGWAELEPKFIPVYMEAFTEAEIKQLRAFYRSPVGKKSARMMPLLMQRGIEIGNEHVAQIMPEFRRMLAEAKKPQSSAKPTPTTPAPRPQVTREAR